MYEDFFGLKEAPFSIAPNPLYLYMSRQHHEALAHLIYGVGRGGGFVLLTGEVGTGKTTICRCFLQQVPADTDVAFILNPKLNAEQLLATICDELDISYIADDITIKELVDSINHYLLQSHARGRHTVLIIDEAQNLHPDVLEQLRLLTNLETNEKKLLQIVLLGQPELQDMFRQPELRQLAQRITARFHLRELQASEVGPYVRHRLGVAGGRDIHGIFPERTLRRLYQISSGIPRLINVICDRSLLGAYAHNLRTVDVRTLEAAAREVLGEGGPILRSRPRILTTWLAVSGGALLASLVWAGATQWTSRQAVTASTQEPTELSPDTVTASQDGTSASAEPLIQQTPTEASSGTAEGESADSLAKSTVDATTPAPSESAATPSEATSSTPADAPLDLSALHASLVPAMVELAAHHSIDLPVTASADAACAALKARSVACFDRSAGLGYIRKLGLPVIVEMDVPPSGSRFALLEKIDEHSVGLRAGPLKGETSLGAFSLAWKGRFIAIWSLPRHYEGVVSPGGSSPLLPWLRDSLLRLGDTSISSDLPVRTYGPELVDAIKRFQSSRGERPDGIVGETTVFRLVRELELQALAQDKENPT